MSQYFDLGGETLWNPSNGAARLFLRQVEVFEAELGLPSGIGPMRNDESDIDPDAFAVFVHALLARHRRTGHPVVLALSEGFVGTVVALARRAGTAIDWERLETFPDGPPSDVQVTATGLSAPPRDGGPWATAVRARAAELDRGMAR
ncbi:hypothetical protein GCM10018980_45560 [Streptomyces capoamus]|uniref:Uncharacterized protein n=1 Tax=Streptomyces capoamus TaxID=68183 RepID=A0A919EYD1_9ACTN|nr:DUF6086 family protein [Streptomyces capoamus]GGW20118.1 hypothetical protein GCM10010501_62740 [Streptomyces libani subsp. rufus]GHG58357.1 hypothetical protein GCM10018980_45560 [Streptomyces capoamus]